MPEVKEYNEGEDFSGSIGKTAAGSEPAWPVGKKAPEGAPNLLMIVLDDTGFAQIGCYGGLGGRIETPNIDRLAEQGLRYNNFHTTALCSPTRASLLTGRNHHSAGVGVVTEMATGFPGYNARIPRDCAMLPAILVENGYNTMAVGKWHLTPDEHITSSGPFDRWPLGQGFERFYGFLPGETSQWEPELWEDNHRIEAPARTGDGYHLTEDLADRAIEWIASQKAVSPGKPFFLYFSTGATHSPHHAPSDYIERYWGRFDDGWDVCREEAFIRQKELGVVPENTQLPPRNPGVRAWDTLSDEEKRLFARQMEVYAAFLTHTDQQIGRLIDYLEESGSLDDTLVILLSDNGASAEGGPWGLISEMSFFNLSPESTEEMFARADEWGGPTTHPHYAKGWAMAGNTPNRWYKSQVHEGGTRDPLIVRLPTRVPDPGSVRRQFHHVVDITPTVLDVLGLEMPQTFEGRRQKPLEGRSMAYTLDRPDAPTVKETQYYEMICHRAVWHRGWKAVATHWSTGFNFWIGDGEHAMHDSDPDADTWELYNLEEDFSECRDLAEQHPERLRRMIELWWREAEKYGVLPLDDTGPGRLLTPRPRVFEERESYRYRSRVKLVRTGSPDIRNRSHSITARIEIPEGGAEGVIVSNGGSEGGYSLFVKDGNVRYAVNYLNREHYLLVADKELCAGPATVRMEFESGGDFSGKATLYINDSFAGDEVIPHTNPIVYAVAEGLEVGSDGTSPVCPEYESPYDFTGEIHEVVLEVEGEAYRDPEAEERVARSIQ